MIIDDKLVLFDMVATGTSVASKVLDLGTENVFLPLFINLKLTQGVEGGGAVTSVKVQSAATEEGAFADEVTYAIPSSVDQTEPGTLLQAFCPIKFGNRYVKLVAVGKAGGKLWGAVTPDVQIQM